MVEAENEKHVGPASHDTAGCFETSALPSFYIRYIIFFTHSFLFSFLPLLIKKQRSQPRPLFSPSRQCVAMWSLIFEIIAALEIEKIK